MNPLPVVPTTGRRLGRRALVLGGSLAGLLSSSVLARHFDQVVIVDRDELTDRPHGARRGVPHGRHSHGLLVGGGRAMERLLPGLSADLMAKGAVLSDVTDRARWSLGGVEQGRFVSGLEGLMASRPLIEDEVRRRVLQLPGVVVLGGHDLTGLVASPDRRRILGATVASRTPAAPVAESVADLIEDGAVLADLVVDATGRGSRAGVWLRELGYPAVEANEVEAGLTYVTRRFRQRPGVLDDLDADIVGTEPGGCRSGVALRQEDGSWTVTLAGGFGERPPSELPDFQTFARSLPTAGIAQVATECEPVGEPLNFRYPSSRWLRWEKLADRPERFTVIGDAVCSFNPVYGQGMSSAALQAEALAEALDGGLSGLPARAAKKFARVVSTPWTLATGSDRRHPSQPAKPLPERLLDRYLDRLLTVAPHDRVVAVAFNRVLNLLAAPPSLLAPRVAAKVLWPGRRRTRPSRPVTPAAEPQLPAQREPAEGGTPVSR
jgi:2-polyprenyl-6-methoxyphenol hydroxylase-like FAD-dependent oxidoreductase